MQAGRDLELMRPLTADGNIDADGGPSIYGCHRGDFHHLNVVNAQAGRIYYYVRRSQAGIRQASLQGWRVCGPEDPERQPLATNPNFANAGLDSSLGLPEIILAWMPEGDYAHRQAGFKAQNDLKAKAANPAEQWRERNTTLESQYQRFRSRGGEPFYFVSRDHGLHPE